MHDSSFHRILLAVVISSFLGCSENKPGPTTQDQKESDCNGVAGGSAITDNCGDCIGGSTGQSACVQDCNETWGGSAVIDACGDCAGGDTGVEACPVDCNQVPNGDAYLDDCGICVGGNTGRGPCPDDCNGDPGGDAELDECGNCAGGETGELACVEDCNSVLGGDAYLDNCEACVGGTTGVAACLQDCFGTWGGTATRDGCNVCDEDSGNDNTTCLVDCAGVANGTSSEDLCGVCDADSNNDNTTCTQDCFGVWNGPAVRDDCGICDTDSGNNNSTCSQDCAGAWGGVAVADNCGGCDTNPSNNCQQDCHGDWGGTAEYDNCGYCVGGNTEEAGCVQDCNGVLGGGAYFDNCSNCVAGNTGNAPCANDCAGVSNGSAFYDNCGDCVGGNTAATACVEDCMGLAGGVAVMDACSRCVGGTSPLDTACTTDCAGAIGGGAFVDECSACVGGSTGLGPCPEDCHGTYGGLHTTVICDSVDSVEICVDLTQDDYCNEDCAGVLDCNGECDGGATFDVCMVCDDDETNNCIADCNGTYGGPEVLDPCGSCDADATNDCKPISFTVAYDVVTSSYGTVREYQIQYSEINLGNFAVDDPDRPDCDPRMSDGQEICDFFYLAITDFTDPYNPIKRTPLELNQYVIDTALSDDGNYFLMAQPTGGLSFAELLLSEPYARVLRNGAVPVNAGDPPQTDVVVRPSELDGQEIGAVAVTAAGDYAYVLYANNLSSTATDNLQGGLHIVNIATQTSVSYTALPGGVAAWDIVVEGDYAYLAGGSNGLLTMNVSDKTNPIMGSIVAPDPALDEILLNNDTISASFGELALNGSILVAGTQGGGEVFDLSNPASPSSTGTFVTTHPNDIEIDSRPINTVQTTVIFIADQSNGLSIYTLDESKAPVRRGALPLTIPAADCLAPDPTAPGACATSASNIEVRGNLVYVTTDMGMFAIVLNF